MRNDYNSNYAPYELPGRWYKITAHPNNDNSAWVIDKSDITGASVSTTLIAIPAGYSVIDYVVDFHLKSSVSNAITSTRTKAIQTNKTTRLTLVSAASALASLDSVDLYVYAYAV